VTVIESILLIALAIAVIFLILGQIQTLKALGKTAKTLDALGEDLRREIIPLLKEATETAAAARSAAASADAAIRELRPALERATPIMERAEQVVAHADEAVVDARITVGAAHRVIAQIEDVVARLRLSEVVMDIVKAKAGDAGSLASGLGQVVKSLWPKRNSEQSEAEAGGGAETAENSGGDIE
jgi:hypothetical protein